MAPAYTMGRAAEMLGTTPAFLRALGEHRLITPLRSEGGHRRYSRYQLRVAARAREFVDQGTPIEAACRIIILEDQLEQQLGAAAVGRLRVTSAREHEDLSPRRVAERPVEEVREGPGRHRQVVPPGHERDGGHRAEEGPARIRTRQWQDVRTVAVQAPHGVHERGAAEGTQIVPEGWNVTHSASRGRDAAMEDG
ncbi:hypothetical protein GCM10010378_45250 [Streptomyces viridochromogenes]